MIIGLSGYAQSGKDTTAELLCLNYKYKRQSFADPMRHALMIINPKLDSITRLSEYVDDYGWDMAKQNPEVRRLLQVFGTDFGRLKMKSAVTLTGPATGKKPESSALRAISALHTAKSAARTWIGLP
jgi:hypothetical protein